MFDMLSTANGSVGWMNTSQLQPGIAATRPRHCEAPPVLHASCRWSSAAYSAAIILHMLELPALPPPVPEPAVPPVDDLPALPDEPPLVVPPEPTEPPDAAPPVACPPRPAP